MGDSNVSSLGEKTNFRKIDEERKAHKEKVSNIQSSSETDASFATAQGNFAESFRAFGSDRELDYTYCFDVYPGDVLFIPKYWWHSLKSLSESISLNFWVDDQLELDR